MPTRNSGVSSDRHTTRSEVNPGQLTRFVEDCYTELAHLIKGGGLEQGAMIEETSQYIRRQLRGEAI